VHIQQVISPFEVSADTSSYAEGECIPNETYSICQQDKEPLPSQLLFLPPSKGRVPKPELRFLLNRVYYACQRKGLGSMRIGPERAMPE
jgi:hypothetical protein